MKKTVLFILCIVVLLFCFTACQPRYIFLPYPIGDREEIPSEPEIADVDDLVPEEGTFNDTFTKDSWAFYSQDPTDDRIYNLVINTETNEAELHGGGAYISFDSNTENDPKGCGDKFIYTYDLENNTYTVSFSGRIADDITDNIDSFTAPFSCLRVVAVGENSAKVYGGFQIAKDNETLKLVAERDVSENDNNASDNKFVNGNDITINGGEKFSFDVTISLNEDGNLQSVTEGYFGEHDNLSYTLTGTGDNITAIAFTAFGPYGASFAANGPMYMALDSVGLSRSAR